MLVQLPIGELKVSDVGSRILIPYEETVIDSKLTRLSVYRNDFNAKVIPSIEVESTRSEGTKFELALKAVSLDFLVQIERPDPEPQPESETS